MENINIKKFLVGASAGAVLLASAAVPVFAGNSGDGSEYGTQPGFAQSSDCGEGHGAFGYFGKNHSVHDVYGGDPAPGQGAQGGVDGGTGDRNSALCGNPQNENF